MEETVLDSSISSDLLRRFDVPGPRYTSYPTADRFVDAFSAEEYEAALAQRRLGIPPAPRPLSLYVHIPFCESLCYYCACNKIITTKHARGASYLSLLERECNLYVDRLGSGQAVTQLHLGGGTPTFLRDDELERLMRHLRRAFTLAADGEYAIEVDPRTVDIERLKNLFQLGFNRLSFGVQDFEPAVQKAVHRIQPAAQVFELVAAAREIGFASVNVDLIYGLPRQTVESFDRTIAQVAQLRPDRIALYAYAHLPARFKPQRHIVAADLPRAPDKVSMLARSLAAFADAGYVHIGMDHFALPQDALATARQGGRLHRNFQGYSTQPDSDLIALGMSAIGRIGASYGQNAKSIEEYRDLVEQDRLPIVRGLAASRDDLVRRAVIMSLMCQGRVVFESIEVAHLIGFADYFGRELEALADFERQRLVSIDPTGVEVTAAGWIVVRAIAMVFDRYLQSDQDRVRYSRIL